MESKLAAIYELLIDQQKSIRRLTLQIEGLKAMMFEHKPPFIDAHAAQVARLSQSEMTRAFDQRIALILELDIRRKSVPVLLHQLEDFPDWRVPLAERHVRRALALDPGCVTAHIGLGAIAQGAKHYDAAIESFERAYRFAPEQAHILAYVSTCRLEAGDAPGAEAAARRALAVEPDSILAWAALGMALSQQDRYAEAKNAFERAESIETSSGQTGESFVGHGFNLIGFGETQAAIDLYRRNLSECPHANAQTHCGFAQLTLGNYRQGWANYEFRWCSEPLASARVVTHRPRWKGQDLRNKTLLLWAEQGAGDFIHFARFITPLKQRRARVIVQTSAAHVAFARSASYADAVIVHVDELAGAFDYHIPMMSVPYVLGIDERSMPADVPYLKLDAQRAPIWQDRIGHTSQLKVGLVWAGNPKHERDRFRSLALAALTPVLGVDGTRFVCLQKEMREGDEPSAHAGIEWVDVAPMLDDFSDTAAAIQALDLVISVDTAVAHLAGALGKPVWTLLPAVGDFRWLTDREDSPWYPTMRLFRQTHLGDWTDVLERVADALRAAVRAQSIEQRREMLLPSHAASVSRCVDARTDLPATTMTRVTETRYGVVQYRSADCLAGRSLEWQGEWLQPQVEWFLDRIPRDATVVETGAGFGAHTLPLASYLLIAGHVIAYESDSKLKRLLAQNLTANRLTAAVTVMRRDVGGPIATSARDASHDAEARPVETLDELQLERLDALKMNSSAEATEILRGATGTLWRHRPLLVITLDEASVVPRLGDEMKAFGYRVWRLDTPVFNPGNHDGRIENPFEGCVVTTLIGLPEEQTRVVPPAGTREL